MQSKKYTKAQLTYMAQETMNALNLGDPRGRMVIREVALKCGMNPMEVVDILQEHLSTIPNYGK